MTDGWFLSCPDPDNWSRRLALQSRPEGGCLLWTGRLDRYGYGSFSYRGRVTGAHRAAWLAFRGPIAPGMVIDHLCRMHACINPDHLEVVTNAVNAQRGMTGRFSGQHAGLTGRLKTQCIRHHPFDEANTRWAVRPDGYTIRVCRTCQRERLTRLRQQRRKTENAP